jgi:hypothetical protein
MSKAGRKSKDKAVDELSAELAGAIDASLSSTLIRGIEILQCFSSSDRALSNAEIARRPFRDYARRWRILDICVNIPRAGSA